MSFPGHGRCGYERHEVGILPIVLVHLPVNVPFGDGATLGVGAADKDGLLDGCGEVINGLGFAVDMLLWEINAEEAGGSGFCVVFLCGVVPTPGE